MLKKEYRFYTVEFQEVGPSCSRHWRLNFINSGRPRSLNKYDISYRLKCVSKPWITKEELKQRDIVEVSQRNKLMEDFFHFIGPSYPKDIDFDDILGDLEDLQAYFDDPDWDESEAKEEFRQDHPELFEARKNHPEEISQFFAKFQDANDKSRETRQYYGHWKPKEEWDELKVIYETALEDFKTLPLLHDSQGIEEVTQQE